MDRSGGGWIGVGRVDRSAWGRVDRSGEGG